MIRPRPIVILQETTPQALEDNPSVRSDWTGDLLSDSIENFVKSGPRFKGDPRGTVTKSSDYGDVIRITTENCGPRVAVTSSDKALSCLESSGDLLELVQRIDFQDQGAHAQMPPTTSPTGSPKRPQDHDLRSLASGRMDRRELIFS